MLQITEKTKFNNSGYQLLDFGHSWQIMGDFGSFKGSLQQVKTYAILELGFQESELDVAILEMGKHFDDCAIFGIACRFMYTTNKGVKALTH